jgi:molybdopterin converting factor small subunit
MRYSRLCRRPTVEVRVFGALWEHLGPKSVMDLDGCVATVADLLASLKVDPSEVGIVTVDGRQSTFDKLVPAGCRVCIFPFMFGG